MNATEQFLLARDYKIAAAPLAISKRMGIPRRKANWKKGCLTITSPIGDNNHLFVDQENDYSRNDIVIKSYRLKNEDIGYRLESEYREVGG